MPAQKTESAQKEKLFNFRKYKKIEGGITKRAKHPKLIVDENKTQFGFMGLTESKKRGHHSNIDLDENPQKNNNSKAYIRKELRYDEKVNFSSVLNNYNLSSEDKKKIIAYLKKIKKKK